MRFPHHSLTRTAAAVLLGCGISVTANAVEQLPATEHQAEVVKDAARKRAQRPETQARMPVTEHQERALRDFEAADANHDGSLSRDEYADFMQRHAARMYAHELGNPERPGVDAQGPRDRQAADESEPAIATTDPTTRD